MFTLSEEFLPWYRTRTRIRSKNLSRPTPFERHRVNGTVLRCLIIVTPAPNLRALCITAASWVFCPDLVLGTPKITFRFLGIEGPDFVFGSGSWKSNLFTEISLALPEVKRI
jgi:hypothetical protein